MTELTNNDNRKIPDTIPYVAHEDEMFRMERAMKKLWIALFMCIMIIFATNAGWLWYQSMYDTISYEQDGAGINNINTGTQGDITHEPDIETQSP